MAKLILEAGELGAAVQDIVEKVHRKAIWPLHVHVIMNGSFMFATDFLRGYNSGSIEEVSFPLIRRGYSEGRVHTPRLIKTTAPHVNWHKLRTHVVLDVIVEEGKTLLHYLDYFPRSLRATVLVAALVQKGKAELPVDWIIGRKLEDVGFLYGYGMGPWRDWGAVYEMTNEADHGKASNV